MSRKKIFLYASLFLAFQICEPVKATPVPGLDLPQLTSDASLIVVGQVISIREENRERHEIGGTFMLARELSAILRVDRTLKGEQKAEVTFKFLIPDLSVGYQGIDNDQFGIFFLLSKSEELSLASPYHPFLVARRDGCLNEGSGLARVISELSCVIQSPNTSVRQRYETIRALESARTPESTAVLQKAAREQVAPLNHIAASILLARNDISALAIVEDAWMRSSSFVINSEGMRSEGHLGHSLEGIKDSSAIPSLTRLFVSEDVIVRRGVVRALGNINTETAIKPLAGALDDSDWEVRWGAVIGLAAIAGPDKDGNSWYPAYDAFKENDRLYLDHWREWLQQRMRNR